MPRDWIRLTFGTGLNKDGLYKVFKIQYARDPRIDLVARIKWVAGRWMYYCYSCNRWIKSSHKKSERAKIKATCKNHTRRCLTKKEGEIR